MKIRFLQLLLLLTATYAKAQKPNIIIIMADDMGYSDIGCFGGEIATPNLDKLAAGGLTMTQFYNASRCCPSRAALLTGLYPHKAGIGDMVDAKPLPAYQGYLSKNAVTIAEVLRSNNYRTYMAGKWHVGSKMEHWPLQRGFDHYYGLIDGASSYFNPVAPYRPNQKLKLVLDNELIKPNADWYATDAYTNYAIQYITQPADDQKPFFLYLAYTSPHWPLQALAPDIAQYKGYHKKLGWDQVRKNRLAKMIKLGILPKNTKLSPRDDQVPAWDQISEQEKEDWDSKMAVYAAMIDRMDQNIGRLLATLKKTGQLNNTLLFFLSDNGASHEEINSSFLPEILQSSKEKPEDGNTFTAYGKRGANVSNTPFSFYKHWQNEGGISTPLIVSYPKVITKKLMNHQPAHITDLLATCLDVASARYPKNFNGNQINPTVGKSLFPLFNGKNWLGHQAIFFEHEGYKAVRQQDWKLVSNFPENKWKLFNMKNDRIEQTDLSSLNPAIVKALEKRYLQWAKENDVVPFEQFNK